MISVTQFYGKHEQHKNTEGTFIKGISMGKQKAKWQC